MRDESAALMVCKGSFCRRSSVVVAMMLILSATTTRAFLYPSVPRRDTHTSFVSSLNLLRDREADFVESMIGGERYSMVPLPDSMLSTTLFVGNLCEFVHDGDLSTLFQSVSVLHSLPACVARKPNTQSLQYGFVAFPTAAEKEAAIIRFDGFEWKGRELRVQPIIDHPKTGRVRVPERLVAYVSGEEKKTRSGQTNTMRRNSREVPKKPAKKKKTLNKKKDRLPPRLTEKEWEEMDRAARRGFLTLVGGGGSRGRRPSQLKNVHRQWCDAREKPQIVHFKAFGGREGVDRVLVDLGPLGPAPSRGVGQPRDFFLQKCKTEILAEAAFTDMELCTEVCEDDDDSDEIVVDEDEYCLAIGEANREAWEMTSSVTIGVFEGERANAKSMAKALAALWDIPELEMKPEEPSTYRDKVDKRRKHKKGQRQYRKRGGGHRQAW